MYYWVCGRGHAGRLLVVVGRLFVVDNRLFVVGGRLLHFDGTLELVSFSCSLLVVHGKLKAEARSPAVQIKAKCVTRNV